MSGKQGECSHNQLDPPTRARPQIPLFRPLPLTCRIFISSALSGRVSACSASVFIHIAEIRARWGWDDWGWDEAAPLAPVVTAPPWALQRVWMNAPISGEQGSHGSFTQTEKLLLCDMIVRLLPLIVAQNSLSGTREPKFGCLWPLCGVQCGVLLPHSSRGPSLILNLGSCLTWSFPCSPYVHLASLMVLWFSPSSRKTRLWLTPKSPYCSKAVWMYW